MWLSWQKDRTTNRQPSIDFVWHTVFNAINRIFEFIFEIDQAFSDSRYIWVSKCRQLFLIRAGLIGAISFKKTAISVIPATVLCVAHWIRRVLDCCSIFEKKIHPA